MREEVCAAVKFFACFIAKSETFPREQLSNFEKHLTDLLIERFEKHWFPDLPSKGQGYRCIRVNGVSPVDLTLEMAASKCGLRYTDLRLPTELTVWVDPSEVCYRLGESEGSYCTLATFPSENSSRTSSESSSASSSTSTSPRPATSLDGSPSPSPASTPPLQQRAGIGRKSNHHSSKQQLNQSQQQPRHPGFKGFEYVAPVSGVKYRNHQQGYIPTPSSSLRTKQSPREMNFNFNPNHRPMYRCDGPPYPMAPPFYRNVNYNRNHYKNVVRV